MKLSPQTQPSSSPNNPHSSLNEGNVLGTIGKSARVVVQLLHGLLHLRRAGVAAQGASPHRSLARRAQKLHRLCVSLIDHLGVECKFSGPLPDRGLLVTNHVSFLDIMFLGALKPMVFVSKSEVAQWPLVGNIATCAGTIYVERNRRADVSRVNVQLKNALEADLLVTLFPEGTSSDGTQVLPFQASLLQPAVDLHVPVTPGFLSYRGMDGSRADDVAYFGDRDLLPCLLALLNRKRTTASLRCSPAIEALDRKKLTASLHAEVLRLSREEPL